MGDRLAFQLARHQQLQAVVELQRQAGRTTFLVVATTETDEELAAVVDAIAPDQVATVLLTAPADVLTARIDAREHNIWPGSQRLMSLVRHLAVSMPRLAGIDVRVATNDAALRGLRPTG